MRNGHLIDGTSEPHKLSVGLDRFSSLDADHLLLIVQNHIQDEVQTCTIGCFRDRFVERISLDTTQSRGSVIDKGRSMGVGDQAFSCRANRDRLPTPGVTRILVRLHKSSGDQQVGCYRCLVNGNRHPSSGRSQIDQHLPVTRFIVDHMKALDHAFPQFGHFFLVRGGPVHPDPAKQCDILVTNPGCLQLLQQGRHQQVVWTRASDVREHDTYPIPRVHELVHRRGVDRTCQSLSDSGLDIIQWLYRF